MQNEKIENPQTLPEYRSLSSIRFLFYANGDKIGLAALTSVSRAPNNALFELRLKINKTINLAIEYLNEKNIYLRTVWNVLCPIPSQLNLWAIFAFLQYFTHFNGQKKQNWEGKRAPWYMAWSHVKLIQRKNRVSSSNSRKKIFGLLKIGRQTKVAQRTKHAIPCHATRGEKSTKRSWKRQ